jgi:hypothetical protein
MSKSTAQDLRTRRMAILVSITLPKATTITDLPRATQYLMQFANAIQLVVAFLPIEGDPIFSWVNLLHLPDNPIHPQSKHGARRRRSGGGPGGCALAGPSASSHLPLVGVGNPVAVLLGLAR